MSQQTAAKKPYAICLMNVCPPCDPLLTDAATAVHGTEPWSWRFTSQHDAEKKKNNNGTARLADFQTPNQPVQIPTYLPGSFLFWKIALGFLSDKRTFAVQILRQLYAQPAVPRPPWRSVHGKFSPRWRRPSWYALLPAALVLSAKTVHCQDGICRQPPSTDRGFHRVRIV